MLKWLQQFRLLPFDLHAQRRFMKGINQSIYFNILSVQQFISLIGFNLMTKMCQNVIK